MTQRVASVLAYVRTPDGVVEVHPGKEVPEGAEVEHVKALADAGVLVTKVAYDKAVKAEKDEQASESTTSESK